MPVCVCMCLLDTLLCAYIDDSILSAHSVGSSALRRSQDHVHGCVNEARGQAPFYQTGSDNLPCPVQILVYFKAP